MKNTTDKNQTSENMADNAGFVFNEQKIRDAEVTMF